MSGPALPRGRPPAGATAGSRAKLIDAALRLFVDKGYERASTREICDSAGTNISSIRYYFGDKAGLYRAVFVEPMGELQGQPGIADYSALPMPQAITRLYREFLEPLKHGETVRLVMRLHFRELVEPTGLWPSGPNEDLKLMVDTLVRMLTRHFDARRADADIHRLAFALIGMAVQFYVDHDDVNRSAPQLLNSAKAIDTLAQRLAGYALAIISAERQRRSGGANAAADDSQERVDLV